MLGVDGKIKATSSDFKQFLTTVLQDIPPKEILSMNKWMESHRNEYTQHPETLLEAFPNIKKSMEALGKQLEDSVKSLKSPDYIKAHPNENYLGEAVEALHEYGTSLAPQQVNTIITQVVHDLKKGQGDVVKKDIDLAAGAIGLFLPIAGAGIGVANCVWDASRPEPTEATKDCFIDLIPGGNFFRKHILASQDVPAGTGGMPDKPAANTPASSAPAPVIHH